MQIGNKFHCESCETKNATLIMITPSFIGLNIKCEYCSGDEIIEGLEELGWYLSEALDLDESTLFTEMFNAIINK